MSDANPIISAAGTFWSSLVRTVVPYVIGFVLALFVKWNIPVPEDFEESLTGVLTAVFGSIWYAIVRLLETYVTPKLGWLIGLAKSPAAYTKESPNDVPAPVQEAIVDAAETAAADDTPDAASEDQIPPSVG